MKPKTRVLWYFGVVIIGFLVWGVFAYSMTYVRHTGYPLNSFLYSSLDRFMDFYNVNKMVSERNPYVEYYSSYPPLALVLAYPFSLFVPYKDYEYPVHGVMHLPMAELSILIFMIIYSVWIVIGLFLYIRREKLVVNPVIALGISIIMLVSAPYCFMVDRGNFLVIAIACMVMFLLLYGKNDIAAAIFLGFAIALKIYPAFLLILLFIDKKWKPIRVTLSFSIIISLISFLFFKGGYINNLKEFIYAVFSFGGAPGPVAAYVHYCIGLTSLLRLPFLIWNHFEVPESFPLFPVYFVIGTGLSVWSMLCLRNEKVFAKKLMILSILMIFLTPNSYIYNGTYLIPACLAYICHGEKEKKVHDLFYLITMGLFMIPKAYYYIYPEHLINIAVPIDSILLLIIVLYYNIADHDTRKVRE